MNPSSLRRVKADDGTEYPVRLNLGAFVAAQRILCRHAFTSDVEFFPIGQTPFWAEVKGDDPEAIDKSYLMLCVALVGAVPQISLRWVTDNFGNLSTMQEAFRVVAEELQDFYQSLAAVASREGEKTAENAGQVV